MKCVNGFRVMKERMVNAMSDKMWKLGWLVVMVVGIGVGVQVMRVLEEVRLGVRESRDGLKRVEEVVKVYEQELKGEKSRKAVEAGIAAAASWQATARLVNTTTIPQVNGMVRELGETSRKLGKLVEDQNGNITNTMAGVSGLLGTVDQEVRRVGETVQGVGGTVEKVGERVEGEVGRVGDGVVETVKGVGEVVRGFEGAGRELEGVMKEMKKVGENLAEASESAPGVARGLEKVASKAPWYQKLAAYGGLALGLGALWR